MVAACSSDASDSRVRQHTHLVNVGLEGIQLHTDGVVVHVSVSDGQRHGGAGRCEQRRDVDALRCDASRHRLQQLHAQAVIVRADYQRIVSCGEGGREGGEGGEGKGMEGREGGKTTCD
jgi:hypothetical protein